MNQEEPTTATGYEVVSITVDLSLTAADHKATAKYIKSDPRWAKYWRYDGLTGVVLGVSAIVIYRLAGPLVFGVIAATILVVKLLTSRKESVTRELQRDDVAGPMLLDAKGMSASSFRSSWQLHWIATEDLKVTEERIFIRTSGAEAVVIPRRLLRDAEDVDRIVEWRRAAIATVENPPAETPPTDAS